MVNCTSGPDSVWYNLKRRGGCAGDRCATARNREGGALLREASLSNSRIISVAIGLYLLVVVTASIHFNISLTPDRVVILLLIAALGTGRVRLFLKDWSIFLVVLLAWQALSSVTRHLGHLRAHVTEMIVVDKALFFGQVPTVWLQQRLFHPHHLEWYDMASTVLYLLHFAFPLAVAFALWYWKRPIFLQFMLGFLLLALAGFATNVLFPAAPPWAAANWWNYLPHVHRIFQLGVASFGGDGDYSAFYQWLWQHIGWDQVAAVPSEHAAFPFLCFLYARLAWKRAGWFLLPYCGAVWFSIVYLGEHYVADAIAGVLYAAVAYIFVQRVIAPRLSGTLPASTESATSE